MTALALLVVLAQGPALEVTASVNKSRLAVGEELTLTVRARTRGSEPLDLALPRVAGLGVVGTREITEVSLGTPGGPVRVTTRELTLRAERAGRHVIGAVTARQGSRDVSTAPITVTVDSAPGRAAAALGPVARAIAGAAPPPVAGDEVTITVVLSGDTAVVGEQVDVVAIAWFPRALRERLARPPVITLPAGTGVWTLPQHAPEGVALSRRVGDAWYDLFVAHAIVFPLAPGNVAIAPPTVNYAMPLSFSFFTREEQLTRRADTVRLAVLPLPPGDSMAMANGVAGGDVQVALDLGARGARVGEPIEVITTVSGAGNVALWPEPAVRWPAGFRSYAATSRARVEVQAGRVVGTKTFGTVVIPDSSGTFVLPEVRYPYFEVATGRYALALVPSRSLVVAAAAEPRAARSRPVLRGGNAVPWSARVAAALSAEQWLALALLPPALVLLSRRRRPARVPAPPEPLARRESRLGRLERDFQAVLTAHVPDTRARFGTGLPQALRAAGVEGAVADHVVRLRDRLRAARYGPGGAGDEAELAAELEQVLARLGGAPRRRSSAAGPMMTAVFGAIALIGSPGAAQTLSAEGLYDAGALRAAGDSFAARAAARPEVPANWYNLGATLYRAGADGPAIAAWTHAARGAPRDPLVRRARELLRPPDASSAALLAVGPLTPVEWGLLAGAAWTVLWGLILVRRAPRMVTGLAAVVVLASAAWVWESWRQTRPVAVVRANSTAVRSAPHGGATSAATLDAGAAVLTGRAYGPWVEVSRGDGVRGWVLAAQVTRP